MGILVTAFLLVAEVRDDVALHLVVEGVKCCPIDGHCRLWLRANVRWVHVKVEVVVQVGIVWMDVLFWFDGVQHWHWSWALLCHIVCDPYGGILIND